jgi:hypothetical protein
MKPFHCMLLALAILVLPVLTAQAQSEPEDTNGAATSDNDAGLVAQPKPPEDSLASRPHGFKRCIIIPDGYYYGAWETMHLQCFYKHQSIWITGHFRCAKQHHVLGRCRQWVWIPGNWLLR